MDRLANLCHCFVWLEQTRGTQLTSMNQPQYATVEDETGENKILTEAFNAFLHEHPEEVEKIQAGAFGWVNELLMGVQE